MKYKREEILAIPRNIAPVQDNMLYALYDDEFNKKTSKDIPGYRRYGYFPHKLDIQTKDAWIVHMDRNDLEENPNYMQLVTGLVIKCGKSTLLLNCINGAMEGNHTLIQGHANYQKDLEDLTIKQIMLVNMFREFGEEIKIEDARVYNKLCNMMRLRFFTFDSDFVQKRISYYHFGFIYVLDLTNEPELFYSLNESNEPEKNRVVFTEFGSASQYKLDDWAREICSYYANNPHAL